MLWAQERVLIAHSLLQCSMVSWINDINASHMFSVSLRKFVFSCNEYVHFDTH